MIAALVLGVVAASMLAESRISRRHERALRAQGAHEAEGDVYPWMQVAYPGVFLLMTAEGLLRGTTGLVPLVAGGAVFVSAKALKYWAIASLGRYWSFRVLVVRGAPLVRTGPYRWLRHPNYVAVVGELVGAALLLQAPVTGLLGTFAFGELLRRRIAVEERALMGSSGASRQPLR